MAKPLTQIIRPFTICFYPLIIVRKQGHVSWTFFWTLLLLDLMLRSLYTVNQSAERFARRAEVWTKSLPPRYALALLAVVDIGWLALYCVIATGATRLLDVREWLPIILTYWCALAVMLQPPLASVVTLNRWVFDSHFPLVYEKARWATSLWQRTGL
jgi:hypothetical protein